MFFSGLSALVYQITWARLLGLTMGSTAASVATVLAAFFLGLALGSAGAGRLARGRHVGWRGYALLETAIALSAVAILPVLLRLDRLMPVVPRLGDSTAVQFLLAMAVLLVPTMAIGATFPILSSHLLLRAPEQGGLVARLYSIHTLGAVGGALLGGFVLVPRLGLIGATLVAAAANLLIAGSAWLMPRERSSHAAAGTAGERRKKASQERKTSKSARRLQRHALLVLFATGFISLAAEVGWTKYLSVLTGTTLYGFSAILAMMLLGVTLGAAFIRRKIGQIQSLEWWLAAGLALLAVALLATRSGLGLSPMVYELAAHAHTSAALRSAVRYGYAFLVLLPATLVLGALFPIGLELYCGQAEDRRRRIGQAYAVNTAAGILGSTAAGFWLIPYRGTDKLLVLLAFAAAAASLVFLPTLAGQRRRALLAAPLLVIGSARLLPPLDYHGVLDQVVYRYAPDAARPAPNRYLFFEESNSGVVDIVSKPRNRVALRINGLQEASFNPTDPFDVNITETLLGLLPALLHPQPKAAFVIGFGGGTTAQVLSYVGLEQVRVVELDRTVVEAVKAVTDGLPAALRSPLVELDINDARNVLASEKRRYDILVSQPSHPWISGAGKLFTIEFFTLVDSRLEDDGIFGLWINLFHMDSTTLQSILAAFYDVFPHGFIFANMPAGDLLVYGSRTPLVFEPERIGDGIHRPSIDEILRRHAIENPESLWPYFALSRRQALEASAEAIRNTDTRMLSEVRLAALDVKPGGREDPYAFLRERYTFDVLPFLPTGREQEILGRAARAFHAWGSRRPFEMALRHLRNQNSPLVEELEALDEGVVEWPPPTTPGKQEDG